MATLDDFLKRFPPELQESARNLWEALGSDEQSRFITLLSGFPSDANLLKLLVRLSTAQFRQAFGHKRRVAIVGPGNVGKSTLYNQMVSGRSDLAAVSPLPGTTRDNYAADAGLFTVVDTPGADAIGEAGEREKYLAFTAAEEADFLIIVFDAIQGIKKTELEIYHELAGLKKPFIVVFNKIDLVPRKDLTAALHQAAASLGLKDEQVIPVAALDGKNLAKVLVAIAAMEPEIVAALGQAMPEYRWQLAWRSIVSSASVSAAIALAPLPVIDFIPLVMIQSVMVLGIARIYSFRITPKRAMELVATFGLGFLGRTIFQELSKLGGLPGWLLSAAIASSTTVVMGYAAVHWFESGQRLSSETLNKLTHQMTFDLLGTLKSLGKRRPSKEALQQQITTSLEASLMAENKANLDQQAGV